MKRKEAEYVIPNNCENCDSDNIAIKVFYETNILRYICLDCGYARNVAKQENIKRRVSSTLQNWAKGVIKCQPSCRICGSNENLEAHHIIPVSHSVKHKFMPSNGIALCRDCHYLVHNKSRY